MLFRSRDKGILARSKKGTGSLSYSIDERGVIYEFEAPNTPLGNEVLEGLKRGDYNESSFAFTVEKDSWTKKEDGTYLRHIERIKEIYDFSVVADGAYSATHVSVAKRSLEAFKETELPEIIEEAQIIEEEHTEDVSVEEQVTERSIECKEDEEERNITIKTNIKMEKFSLLKTINDVVNNRTINDSALEVIEAGKTEMRKSGQNYSG